jgi:glutaminyl-peptide cyclotransferase
MSRRTGLIATAGLIALAGGAFMFFHPLDAKPKKEDTGDPAARKAGNFDGDRALAYLSVICDLGPRISGTEGMTKQQELIQKHFEKHGATVTLQKFDGKQPSREKSVPMANMIVSWHPTKKERVILSGHYDTRPIADQETNVRDWTKPFASANDGASTVAFFMEMAPLMKDLKTEVGVDFVLFDGEEFIFERNRDKFFLGSDHFAAQYLKDKGKVGPKYKAAINLDLFAGKGAVFPIEVNSSLMAGPVVEDVWKIAEGLGVKCFKFEYGEERGVLDDHIALNRAGIPAIDIIDFSYDHWHRLSDTPDKCSAESMASVAKVLMAWMQKVK